MGYKRSIEVLQTETDTGLALLDSPSNTYFLLNATGAFIWSELQQESTLEDLCASVSNTFNVAEAECKADVKAIISALREKGLIVTSDESPN